MGMNQNATNTPTYSFFFVSRQTGGTNGRVFVGDYNTLYGYWGGGKKNLYTEGWIEDQNQYPSDTSWDLITIIRRSSGAIKMFWNGSLVKSATASGIGFVNFFINTGGCCGGERSDAQVAEVLVYNTAITSTPQRQIEGYLAWKWGLNGNLPTTHPYYGKSPS
jgi:hypothetical protein